MLRTAVVRISANVTVTVKEATNGDWYAGKRMYTRLYKPELDNDMEHLLARFVLIETRTVRVDGMEYIFAGPDDPVEDLEKKFKEFLNVSKDMAEKWAQAIANIATYSPTDEEGNPDPN